MKCAPMIVATALFASATAFAQTTAPETTTTSRTTTTQDRESPATPVTLIGCVQREADYRKAHDIKRGGRLNTGLGDGDEYILINAVRVSPGSAPTTMSADCTSSGSGEAFEITGGAEEQFKTLVGKRVEVSGTQKRAKIGSNGQPTGGSDPMGGDLKLFEVEVSSVKEATAAAAQAPSETPAPATTAAEPAPAPVTAPPPAPEPPAASTAAPAPTGTSGQAPTTTLPHTASPLPLFALASLLAFGAAYGVRRLRMM